jgi:hypothetical protein
MVIEQVTLVLGKRNDGHLLSVLAILVITEFGWPAAPSTHRLIGIGKSSMANCSLIQVVSILRIDHRHFSWGIPNLLG